MGSTTNIQNTAFDKRKRKAPGFVGRVDLENPILKLVNIAKQDSEEQLSQTPGNSAEERELYDKVEKTKITDVAPFLINKPNAPESRQEDINNAHRLTKVGALSQLVDSLGSILLSRNNPDYRNVPVAGDDLAFQSMQQVYELDGLQQQEIGQFKDQVRATDIANNQITNDINRTNQGIDVQLAELKMQFSDRQEMRDLETKSREAIKEDQSNAVVIESGLRMLSQGEIKAGVEMLKRGGVDVEGIEALVGKEKDATIYDRLKAYTGQEVTPLQANLIVEFKKLETELANPTAQDYGYDGTPKSSRARRLESLRKSLGDLAFVPDSLFAEETAPNQNEEAGTTNTTNSAQFIDDERFVQAKAQNLHHDSRYQGMPELQGNNQSVLEYVSWMADKSLQLKSQDENIVHFTRLLNDLQSLGLSFEQADQLYTSAMSAYSKDTPAQGQGDIAPPRNTSTAVEQFDIPTNSAPAGPPKTFNNFSEATQAFLNGSATIEEIKAFSPTLARQLQKE